MTREEAKEYLPIMQAFAEGKTIQYLDDRGFWNDIKTCVSFDYNISCYRIKPEPKYRPFKTQEECWDEMLKHQPFGWVVNNGDYLCLISINKHIEEKDFSYMFRDYTFIDSLPFGIKEE